MIIVKKYPVNICNVMRKPSGAALNQQEARKIRELYKDSNRKNNKFHIEKN